MRWPWQSESEEEVPDPDLDEAKAKQEELLRRMVALGEEADNLLRRP
jgi:hypothetical protein